MVEVVIALKKEQEEGVVDIDSGDEEAEKKAVNKRRTRKKTAACDPYKKRACVDCTMRCARIHARVSSSSSSKAPRPIPAVLPSFFKVMLGYFSESMDIPPPFAKTIMDLAGSNVYLEDSFGLRWRVRVGLRDDGVLSFGHGFKNFILDHAVSCGEFLVFRQIARSVFTVQMFAPSAVERLYLCEKNKRQSRKRKPRQKQPSSPRGIPQTGKMSKDNGESCKKKRRRNDQQNDQVPIDCKMPVQVCIDDSGLKYSETSEKAPEAGVAESQEVYKAFTRHQGNVPRLLHGQIEEIANNCTIFTEHPIHYAAEIAHAEGSSLLTDVVDASEPLAMMDLNEVSIDDMYLSADIYEFESGLCNPEAFPVNLNKEGLITDGQTSGFDCLEHDLGNQHSSMGVGQGFVMSDVLPCIENKLMIDAPEICKSVANVPAHEIDINLLPGKEPSSLGQDNSSPPTDAEVQFSECASGSCSKDKCACNVNQAAPNEGFVPSDSSAVQDKPQNGQVNMQDSTEQHAAEIMSSSLKPNELRHLGKETDNNSESGRVLALAEANKFCIAVPPPGQTWLELPSRLPAIPRRKKQGRKVVILKDPCMRRWPVLYQCTPRFSGFITGWVDISKENGLLEGDTCEFELSGNYELSFQVRSSHCCPAT